MIRSVFGLAALPFGAVRSPSHLYASAQAGELHSRLARLLEHRGMALISGEVGAGKQALCLPLCPYGQAQGLPSTQVFTLCLPLCPYGQAQGLPLLRNPAEPRHQHLDRDPRPGQASQRHHPRRGTALSLGNARYHPPPG